MHIAYLHYLCDDEPGLNHVHQFARAARALGHDVNVHAMNLARSAAPDVSSSLRASVRAALKRRFSRYLHEPKELLWNARYAQQETRLLRADRPHVLLTRDHLLTASCLVVSRRLSLPLVLEQNAPSDESRLYLDYLHVPYAAEWLEAWKLRSADAVTVVSSALKEHLIRRYQLPARKLSVAPNGADPERFRCDLPGDPQLPEALARAPVVGFVGSFQKWHGVELLGRTVMAVGRARPDVRFLMVGEGPGLETLRRMTAALGDRVWYTGRVLHDRIPSLVASLDVGVMPESNFYGSPLKVIEWMSAGKAVVAPAYGPLRDLIENGVEGILFPPGDARELERSVVRLVDNRELRREMGRAAAVRVRSTLSWRHNAERVLSACEHALANHASRRSAGRRPWPD